jgi:glucosamine--fructose-6-phosphate aminotransferase (isomerizing)
VRDLVSQEQANQLRRELKQGAIHGLDSTLAALREPVRAAAAQLRDAHSLMTVGAGPHLGTALFSAAKMSEACGLNASGHDVEEWRHVQYYVSSIPSLPTVLFATGGAADDRVAEVAEAARRVGRFVIMVAPANATGAAAAAMTHAQRVLPVSCALPEALSPLVYLLPGALLAAELCVARGDRPFNGFAGPYAPNAPNAPRTT